jgi:hypothetical protein
MGRHCSQRRSGTVASVPSAPAGDVFTLTNVSYAFTLSWTGDHDPELTFPTQFRKWNGSEWVYVGDGPACTWGDGSQFMYGPLDEGQFQVWSFTDGGYIPQPSNTVNVIIE